MRGFIRIVLGVGGFAVAGLLFIRHVEGLDLLTGADPRSSAGIAASPHLHIAMVPRTGGLFEATDPQGALKGYFQLIDGERMTGRVELRRCNAPGAGERIPRFATGSDWVCTLVDTDEGARRHVSFSLRAEALEEAWSFYEAVLDKLPSSSSGSQKQSGSRWNAVLFSSDIDGGRRVHVRFHSTPPAHGPLITIADTAAR